MSLVIENLTKEELINKYYEQEDLINKLNSNINSLSDELSVSINLFENSPTPMWEEDITELINYIEKIKSKSNVHFKQFLDQNPKELLECIKKIKPINVNNALVKLHKAKSKQELLNNLDQVFIEEAIPAFKEEIIAIANGKTSFICLTKSKTFNNEILDLKLYLQITKAKSQSSVKYTAIISTVNITDQKKTEEKLLRSEKTLRAILDASEDIVILLDPNGFILESNKACQDFYNVHKIDLVGRKLKHFASKEVAEDRKFYFMRAKNEKKTITFKNSAYDKIWISTISPILDVNGEVEKLAIFHKDITSKHYSEIKLRDSELKFKSIFNNIQTSIVHIDRDGFITDINEYHLKHISKSKRKRKDYIGVNILDRHSIIKAGIIDYYKELIKGKRFKINNVYFPITTGEESAYFNIQGIPLFEDGKVTGAILTTEDVTDEVITEQKVVQIEQRLGLALEGAGIGFWEEDIVNNKFSRSNHWFEMLGYKKSEFSNGPEVWRNLIHPDDLQNSLDIVRKHYLGEIDHIRIEHRLKNSKNNYQWILNWGKVIERDEKGNPLRVAGIHLDFTEQKNIAERNKYLASMLESSPLAYTVTDLNGLIIDINPAMEDLGEYSKEELLGKKPGIFNAEINAEEIQNNIFDTLSNNKVWDGEILNKKKNGELFYNHTTIFPLINQNGETYSFAAFNEDVTERIRSNNIIKEQEEYVKSIFSSAPIGIGVVINRVFNKVNLKLCEMTGYTQEELIGKSSKILYPTLEEFNRVGSQKYSQIEHAGSGTLETKFRTKDGHIIYILLSSTPIDKNDLLKGVTFTALDITSRKLDEESLRQYENIVSSSSDLIALVDKNYKYLAANNSYLDSFNLTKNELIGKNVLEVFGDTFFYKVLKPKAEKCMKGEAVNYQEWLNISESNTAYMDVSYFPYKGKENKVLGFVVNARNITERKLIDETLNEQMRINQQILETTMDGYILADTEGNIQEVNSSYSKMIGYSQLELQTMNISALEIVLPKEVIDQRIQQMVSKGGLKFKTKHKHKLGYSIDLDVSITVIKKKEEVLIAALVRNISEQLKAEIKIRESEDKFSKIFKITPYVLIISRISDGKLLDFNDYTMKIIGLSREEMLNRTSTDLGLLSSEQRNILVDKIESKGFFNNVELTVTLPNGEKRVGLFHGRKIKLGNEECIFQTILDITDRIEAEKQVRESEEKFHKIFRNSPDAIVLTKLSDGEIVEVNDATLKMTEKKLEDLIGKKTTEFMIWENLSDRERYVNILSKSSRVHDFETNFIIGQGEIRNCLISGELIKINNIDYVLGIIRDVTEKKKAENALIESESKYRLLVENQSDLVVEVNKLNHFTFVSPSYCQLFGKSEEELLGKSFFPMIHPEDSASTEEEMKKLFHEPYTCRVEQRAMTVKGWRWLEWNDTAQLDDFKNVKSILGVGRDITDKKESEIALIASEEKFYKIFKNSPDAIILTKLKDGEVIDINDSTTEILGYERSEIVGKRTTQISLWHSPQDRINYISIVNKHGIAKSLTVDFIKKGGEIRTGMLSGVLLDLNNEHFIIGILRDITEKTLYENKLKETNERLRNLASYMNKVREEERKNFAREVHDNLGQKLTALNLDISWIKQNIPDELVDITKQFDPVLELINQSIITVQKISTELRPGILDDLGLVNAIQWQSNEISRRTDLNFSLNLFKNEIDLDDNVKTALFRVFQESLTNIVRHANANNVLVNLLIKEKKLIFEVIDDGRGISESEINEFTSLGIIGMKERIASINGEIIFSRLTKGTMIQISVPIKVEK